MSIEKRSDFDSLRKFYESRGLGGTSGFGSRPAIVVVDLIRGFTEPRYKLGADFDSVIRQNVRLLSAARRNKICIVFTTVMYQTPAEGGAFLLKVPALREFTPGTPLVEVDPRLNRRKSEMLLVKKYASAFFGTPLASILSHVGADTVIVTGVTTSGCVRATAVDALQYGYKVVIPSEGVGDRAKEPHLSNLFDLGTKYAEVYTMKDVLKFINATKHDKR